MIEIKNFFKSYDGKTNACEDITLTIEKGDIYGFIGHNGAGKTTLLRSIAGILDFEKGKILVGGHDIKTEPIAAKKMMAYIPDNPDVYETLKGMQYLDFIADVYEIDAETRKATIEKYAKMFEMENVLNNPIGSYSHGMKQKIVIIGALIHRPKVLLLDEPFVGLDPKASYLLKEVFKELCDEGSAIFFSTHVLEVVEKLCNKVAIIRKGKIVAEGETTTVTKDQSLESLFLELIAS
ncbi:MAG: ABC transporter ATP-binding protein [Tenericutes bacterium HGW-Tenericutes-1]|jgi:ABC-2 type transport system ATP-binding protein|nr:MAG: ABC transporter ATP-binding protein [Tenericutes bacterium HGW-Tenericutes-1]